MFATSETLIQANPAMPELMVLTPPPQPKRRGTLLIVDDEEGPRMSLRLIFKDTFNLLLAEDGLTAIELAQKHPIDVAILDIRMAGMSGIEVLERLRFVQPDIEAVMITAFETTDTMRQALRLRAADYINKPFDIATIRAAVNGKIRKLRNRLPRPAATFTRASSTTSTVR
jgi:DNA-binding NtrC family response regulator